MSLNTRRLERSQKSSSSSGGGGFFRFQDGRNIIRVFTFNHKATDSDFKKGFYKSDEVKVDKKYDEIDREVYRHFTEEGVVNCLLTDCKYCKEAQQYLDSSKKSDKKIGNQLKASRAFYINVVDMQGVEKGMQIGNIPPSVYNVIVNYVMDTEYGEGILGCSGRDFVVDLDKSQDPNKMYSVKIRDEKRCEELDEEFTDEVTDLFLLSALEPGWSSNDDLNESEGTDEDDSERVDRKKASKKKKDNEDDNDFEDDKKKSESDDDQDTDGKLPWENGEDGIQIGAHVEFVDEGEVLQGVIEDINTEDEEATIKVKKDLYDIPFNLLKILDKKKKSRKR